MKTSRCNRQEDRKGKVVSFGSEEYSKEELVAEVGSAQLMNMVGIETNKIYIIAIRLRINPLLFFMPSLLIIIGI